MAGSPEADMMDARAKESGSGELIDFANTKQDFHSVIPSPAGGRNTIDWVLKMYSLSASPAGGRSCRQADEGGPTKRGVKTRESGAPPSSHFGTFSRQREKETFR
jgi:hypothetical protein